MKIALRSLLLVFCIATTSAISLAETTVAFPSIGAKYQTPFPSNSGTLTTPGQISGALFLAGDSISQKFAIPEPFVSSIEGDFQIQNNLALGISQHANILLNGSVIGSWTVAGKADRPQETISFSTGLFPPVVSFDGTYTLSFEMAWNIPFGLGAIAFIEGGSATFNPNTASGPVATPVPEPSTYGLMGAAGLAGLGLLRRFRRKHA